MKSNTVNELYGLKIGDKVKYIGNDKVLYNSNVFNEEGVVRNILPQTGEFHVSLSDLQFDVSFQRYGLLLMDPSNDSHETVDFEGFLANTSTMKSEEMRFYLKKYHELEEGFDFSITDRGEIKEVMLTNEKYSLLLKELLDIENVSKEFIDDENIKSFKYSIQTQITPEGSISLFFKISDWTFRTHLSPWFIHASVLSRYDIDLYKELGFNV